MSDSLTNLVYHIVFGTKNREPMIRHEIRDELYAYIGGVVRNKRCILLAIGGMPCHVHLLVKIGPTETVSDMVRVIKSNSARWLNAERDIDASFAWQTGYGAFTVSESQVSAVKAYIAGQSEHHRAKSFQTEYTDFLRKNGIRPYV